MPVGVQWLLSVVLLAGMVVWIIVGNTATGSIGTDDCELDSWLVPVAGGVIAYGVLQPLSSAVQIASEVSSGIGMNR